MHLFCRMEDYWPTRVSFKMYKYYHADITYFSLIPLLSCENSFLLYIGREQIILHLSLPVLEDNRQCLVLFLKLFASICSKNLGIGDSSQKVHLHCLLFSIFFPAPVSVRCHFSPFPFTPNISKVDGCFY